MLFDAREFELDCCNLIAHSMRQAGAFDSVIATSQLIGRPEGEAHAAVARASECRDSGRSPVSRFAIEGIRSTPESLDTRCSRANSAGESAGGGELGQADFVEVDPTTLEQNELDWGVD